jgi:hypothetical protein
MKNILKLFTLFLLIQSCTPENLGDTPTPETNIPPKIRKLKLIKYGDTTTYLFNYNPDVDYAQLTSVLKDSQFYANLTYASNRVLLSINIAQNGTMDTFIAIISPYNYIDSIRISPVYDMLLSSFDKPYSMIRGANSTFFSSNVHINEYLLKDRNTSAFTALQTTHLYNAEHQLNNNILSYMASVNYTLFNQTYKDTIVYNASLINQPNLPDQFITNLQSYNALQGVPILTPLFLLQQSNIYPYRTHANLINSWGTHDVNFFAPIPAVSQRDLIYNYTLDTRNRVIQMVVILNFEEYLTYQFEYFD